MKVIRQREEGEDNRNLGHVVVARCPKLEHGYPTRAVLALADTVPRQVTSRCYQPPGFPLRVSTTRCPKGIRLYTPTSGES